MAPRRKRVSLVIRLLAGRSGGAERLYCELANFLSESGYEVDCLFHDEADGAPFYPINPGIELRNLHVRGKRTPKYRLGRVTRKLYSLMNSGPLAPLVNERTWNMLNGNFVRRLREHFLANETDLAISFLPSANTVTLVAADGTGTKVVPTNHNVPREDYTSPLRWDPNPYDRKLRLSALRGAAAVHVLFPRFGDWFPEDIRRKIVAIPNYVSKDIREARPAARREKLILAVGRLAPVKNYLTLVDAWSMLADSHPDWKVILYGVGPQGRELEAKVRQLHLEASFLMPGHRSDMASEYARASIFCHPALFEGFGLSVAEALALEMPVVAFSDCSGVNEFVRDGCNGLMVEREGGAPALARALERLIADEELRASLGGNGPASIAGFTEEAYRTRWLETIERVTA
ncbi:glycosyltransferase [Aquamicrobium sp. LC103]|uniref:glycosyltransferase n=1 Tax=Aquamicrobium sp. LC103 TaxID=1120658 RepID=UPI00063EA2F5|nr:glycosyltransferase [Aquamicrobium sp. LC103]TKT82410.1 glycosyltransferase family 4 protein [Aquamicrobium sp. LC103]